MTKFQTKELYVEKFRNISKKSIYFSKRINVISGINGVGKSNIMSLVASMFGTNSKRLASGGNFHPVFTDFFTIPKEEEFNSYQVHLLASSSLHDEMIQKKHSFSDYSERGIRIIPRASNHFSQNKTLTSVRQKTKEIYGFDGASRIPLPSIYLSLSRLFPLGETVVDVKQYSLRKKEEVQKEAMKTYREWYNKVFPLSISKEATPLQLSKREGKKNVYLTIDSTLPETQSVGQDNLGHIISALLDFYLLKKTLDDYQGGILCIDELDASLHPNAQLNLYNLLKEEAENLDLQIFFTTHSLTLLDYVIKDVNRDSENYSLNYFLDPENPRVLLPEELDINKIKADLFEESKYNGPIIKIYCEDDMTELIFKELMSAWNRIAHREGDGFPEYKIMPVHLGCNNLKALPSIDEHFKDVMIVLDGDAKAYTSNQKFLYKYITHQNIDTLDSTLPNENTVIALPTYLAPESFLFYISMELLDNKEYTNFWNTLPNEAVLYTKRKVREKLSQITLTEDTTNKVIKKSADLVNYLMEFIEKSRALTYYYSQEKNIDEISNFIDCVKNALSLLERQQKARTLL